MYNANGYTVKPLPKVDTVTKAKITKITEGTFEEFVEDKYLDKFPNPTGACIQLEIQTEDGYKIEKLMSIPEDDEVSPKSDLGSYMSKYGKAPEIDDSVKCIYTKKGDKTFYSLLI
jgi:hypothetical protein